MYVNLQKLREGSNVGKTKNTIEINGQRYDATTGEPLGESVRAAATPAKAMHDSAKHTPTRHLAAHQPAKSAATKIHDVARQPAQHTKAHQPNGSKTLMRHAVTKPGTPLKRHTKAHGPSEVAAKPAAELRLSQSVHQTHPRRLKQAKQTQQSDLISHFQSVAAHPGMIIQPTAPTATPQATTPGKASTTADLLERALQHASGHQETAHHDRRKQRRTGLAVAGVLAVLVIGVGVSQNLNNMRLHLASAKAGFDASLPEYQPAGFSVGKFNYSPGEVATSFQSNSNDTSYTLIQQPSEFDSKGLLENVVKPADPNYQVVQDSGRTIYLYSQRTVTWISGGVWYQIQDHDSLSDSQLVKIASSL